MVFGETSQIANNRILNQVTCPQLGYQGILLLICVLPKFKKLGVTVSRLSP